MKDNNKTINVTIISIFIFSVSETLNKLLNIVIEYETPKVVTVHNVSIGLIR